MRRNSRARAPCSLRTYAAIDRCKEAEAIFRSHFVDPFLAKCVTQERLEAGTRGSCKGLDGIYAEIVTFVKDGCSIVLQLAQRSLRGQGFDFLSNSIFPAITHAIQVPNQPHHASEWNPGHQGHHQLTRGECPRVSCRPISPSSLHPAFHTCSIPTTKAPCVSLHRSRTCVLPRASFKHYEHTRPIPSSSADGICQSTLVSSTSRAASELCRVSVCACIAAVRDRFDDDRPAGSKRLPRSSRARCQSSTRWHDAKSLRHRSCYHRLKSCGSVYSAATRTRPSCCLWQRRSSSCRCSCSRAIPTGFARELRVCNSPVAPKVPLQQTKRQARRPTLLPHRRHLPLLPPPQQAPRLQLHPRHQPRPPHKSNRATYHGPTGSQQTNTCCSCSTLRNCSPMYV